MCDSACHNTEGLDYNIPLTIDWVIWWCGICKCSKNVIISKQRGENKRNIHYHYPWIKGGLNRVG